ncbi:hypothetical protein H5410_019310 [Solanum commersonii]|uniref:Uncharacterized protein n=1 Tax=Solanum commersonii TaxID=4109 RepID=A0A9J5Z713_SOLCO|nr:hypothetical protein H5410_019310 [Solanum commersonii]
MAKTSHFQGKCAPEHVKRSPEQVNPPFGRFSCAIIHGLLGDLEFQSIFSKKIHGRPLRPYLWSQLALTSKTSHFHGQTSPGAGKPPFCQFSCAIVIGHLVIRNSNLIFAKFFMDVCKTLTMETVGPHGQNIPFSRSNMPRISYGASWPSRPKHPIFKLRSRLALTAKRFHFHGETSPGEVQGHFGDLEFRTHFFQNFLWTSIKTLALEAVGPSRPKHPIVKPKISWSSFKTLAMESVNPHGQKIPFSRSNDPRSSYGARWPSRPKRPILNVKRSSEQLWIQLALTAKTAHFKGHGLFGDPEFRPHFCQNFTWTFVKTLSMEPVVPYSQIGYFQGQTSHRVGKPLNYRFSCAIVHHLFCNGASWPSRPKRPIFKVKRAPKQSMNILMIRNADFIFVEILHGHLNYGANWPSRPKQPIFKVKRAPVHVNPLFCRFSFAIVHSLFGDTEFRPYFCQNFLWTFFKTLVMEPVGLQGKINHFQGQTRPDAGKPPKLPIFVCYSSPSFIGDPKF